MGRSVSFATDAAFVLYADGSHFEDSHEFNDFVDNLRAALSRAFPSVTRCNKWLDREDRAIAENALGYFGVSEYCGLVSFWYVPKEDATRPLARRWAETAEAASREALAGLLPVLQRLGTFSNGEGVYRRAG